MVVLRPTWIHGWGVGTGPDEAVYLWWTRVGAAEGISLLARRPGAAVLIATVTGTLRMPLVVGVAGLQYAFAIAAGTAAAGLVAVRGRRNEEPGPARVVMATRAGWLLAGLLAGCAAMYLASGYVSNLAFTVTFLAAGAALASATRRGTVAAALLLGGGALAHPQFAGAGGIVLIATAVLGILIARATATGVGRGSWSRDDAGRIAWALGGGAMILGLGALWSFAGPTRLPADTSTDGFLRRIGLTDRLRTAYVDRLWDNARRYAVWITVPTAILGFLRVRGFVRRFLLGWIIVTLVGVPVGIVSGWFPPERLIMFGLAAPILAGLGIAWVGERVGRRSRVIGLTAVAGLLVLLAIPFLHGQNALDPYVSPDDLGSAAQVGRIAATLPAGTPIVVVIDDTSEATRFQATNAANLLRASVPSERAGDVFTFVGVTSDLLDGRPTITGDPEHDIVSRATFDALPPEPWAVFQVREFDRAGWNRQPDPRLLPWTVSIRATVSDPRPLPERPGELRAGTPREIARATALSFLLLLLVGFGWARWTFRRTLTAVGTAPAWGIAVLAIAGLIAERLGLNLADDRGPVVVSAIAAGFGYVLLVLQRRARHQPSA